MVLEMCKATKFFCILNAIVYIAHWLCAFSTIVFQFVEVQSAGTNPCVGKWDKPSGLLMLNVVIEVGRRKATNLYIK